MRSVRVVIFVCIALIAAFLALGGRCLHLQLLNCQRYRSASLRQLTKWTNEQPRRGVILDCRGKLLAASNEVQTIFAEPRAIDKSERVATELAPVLHMGARRIYELITQSKNPGFARLKTQVTTEQCASAARIGNGVGVISQWRRYYPMGRLTSHVVGIAGTDNCGLDGVELKYDQKLRGKSATNAFLADTSRRTIRLRQAGSQVEDGLGLVLTIDAAIQQFVRAELEKQYKSYQAESAVAIVAEPYTGAILAMVSLPDFDPNDISGDANCLRNRAICDQFEPGSMLKPIVAAIALDTGVVNGYERIFCENGRYHGKGFGTITEYGDHKFGNLALREVLIKSSNIGMAKIGQRLGKRKLYDGLRLFGYGKKTGIDLPGEVEGFLRPPDQWTGYSVTRIPFGQEISVTALQMVRAFCVLANGGRMVRPHIVKAIVDNGGNIVSLKRPPPSVGFVVKPETARWIVQDAMVGVVNEKQNGGTGWRAKLDKWQVFGKTGTANIAKSDQRGYSDDDYIASFVAGAPAEKPAVVVLVSIRKPNKKLGKGYTGGVVASPVAGRIIEKTLVYLERHHLL